MNKTKLKYYVLSMLLLCLNASSETLKTDTQESNTALFSNPHQLTFVGPKSGEGYFSADGKKMIFQSEREPGNPFYQMYILDLATGKSQRVSPGFGKTTCGWIHPSMKKVLFSSSHEDPEWKAKAETEIETRKKPIKGRYSWSFDDQYDIYTSDLSGKKLKKLTHEKGYDAEASYSPDGQWIAFASNRSAFAEIMNDEDKKYFEKDESYMMDIYIMKSDGTQVKRLTDSKGYDGGPFFSADGKKITWRRFAPNGATAEIYTMNVDGSEQKAVTQLKSMSWAPFFHPSGDYIIFASSVYGFANFELFIVDTLGLKKPVRVTNNDGFDGLPVFTPDGQKLSWTHRNEMGDSQIMMAEWDDSQARKLLSLPAKQPIAAQMSPVINAKDIKTWIHYLASDEFMGRKTGGASEPVYTAKIADILKSWGYIGAGPKGSFFHEFEVTSGVSLGTKNSFKVVGSLQKDYLVNQDYLPVSFSQIGEFKESPIVFAGYGIKAPAADKNPEYDSYKGLDVHGKWVLILTDIPQDVSKERRHFLNTYSRIQHKVSVAKNNGAVGVIFVNGPLSEVKEKLNEKLSEIKFEGTLSGSSLAVIKISTAAATELLNRSAKDFKSLQKKLDQGEFVEGFVVPSIYFKATIDLVYEKTKGINVVAKWPLSKQSKSIIIGAHGDHLGHGETGSSLAHGDELKLPHYGADDNASGVAGVMELAHAFSQEQKLHPQTLKKNIFFAIWSGEEIGLVGSSKWIDNFSKENKKTISQAFSASINMDMIGRLREKLFVQGVGSGDQWQALAEAVAIETGVPMALQEDPYLPTDAMSFYLAGIPSISFFTGPHGEYHTPRDTPDLINEEGEVRVLQSVYSFANKLASSEKDLVKYVKAGGDPKNKLEGRSFRIYLGTIPDYSQEGIKGVKISGVSKGSPAEVSGLKEKDVIIAFDGGNIENLYDYVFTLQSVKPNKETSIKVIRAGNELELKITPKLKE